MILSKIFELLGSPKPIKITFKNFLNKISLLNLSKNTTNNFIDNGSIKEDYRKAYGEFKRLFDEHIESGYVRTKLLDLVKDKLDDVEVLFWEIYRRDPSDPQLSLFPKIAINYYEYLIGMGKKAGDIVSPYEDKLKKYKDKFPHLLK